ncbi:MAG: DUF1549 domain-containing protein, partial [Gemmataceae bacterium]|nr:DUF1549 domain-containing protein [Gemmataceae bacterium]
MPVRLAPLVALAGLVPLANAPAALPRPADPPTADFDRDVKPVLAAHCLKCHGPDKQKGGLRLDRKADALAGGDSGLALAPGKPADSLLLKLVGGDDPDRVMPPTGERLTAAQVAALRAWVEQGAKWPVGGAAANPADWWSLRPVVKPSVPEIRNPQSAVRNPIDRFVLAKLAEKGLAPSPEADRRTLIRRLHFDLIGLPPTPEEVEAFEKDPAPDAYEKLVDRLLASPHHGERWARHWLDVVHFGETHGYDKDQPRPHAWPYRDYVIRAFNADKPYARFVREQLAGDVLDPGTADGVEALGFLSAGPWDFIGHVELPESKIDGKVARHLDRDDMVATTANTFLGLTAQCAQCHTHKFDPITQEDYYRLQAVFAAVDRTDKAFDPDPAVAARRADLTAKKAAAVAKVTAIEAEARARAGEELAAVERQLGAKGSGVPRPPEFGYHSALSDRPDRAKWVQVDLGESKPVDHVLLRPCHDDFGGIGAGFGFPVRFRVELADDPEFAAGVVAVADHTGADFANPGTKPVRLAAGGKAGRYVRVTATALARRLPDDFIFAVAELEAVDAAGKNLAAGRPVAALDTIEAPVRWRRANLTDGLFPAGEGPSADERAKLAARRDEL